MPVAKRKITLKSKAPRRAPGNNHQTPPAIIKSEDELPTVMTAEDAAIFLRVSVPTVRQMVRDGKFGLKYNAVIRIRKVDLLNYLTKNASPSDEVPAVTCTATVIQD